MPPTYQTNHKEKKKTTNLKTATTPKQEGNSDMKGKIDYPEKAAAFFKQGYNCAQSVLLTMQQYHGHRPNELIPKIATALGGGIGLCGNLCGALTGSILALGMKHGTNQPSHESRREAYCQAQRFLQQFTESFGTTLCRELIGYDLTDPEQLQEARKQGVFDKKCSRFVKKAVEILIEMET